MTERELPPRGIRPRGPDTPSVVHSTSLPIATHSGTSQPGTARQHTPAGIRLDPKIRERAGRGGGRTSDSRHESTLRSRGIGTRSSPLLMAFPAANGEFASPEMRCQGSRQRITSVAMARPAATARSRRCSPSSGSAAIGTPAILHRVPPNARRPLHFTERAARRRRLAQSRERTWDGVFPCK